MSPVEALKSTSNGARQLAHWGRCVRSKAKNDWHPAVCAPNWQAAAALCRSLAGHTRSVGGGVSIKPAAHPGYGEGHCVCSSAQVLGVTFTSHVEPIAVQFWQAAPLCPHRLFTKPAWHVPLVSQQPAQFVASHLGMHWPIALQVSLNVEQLVHACPPRPHAVALVPPTHV
jgi:hypothetical protein